MKLPFMEPTPAPSAITGLVRDMVIQELCDRRQFVLISTPYLSFQGRFIERDKDELRLKVRFGQDSVRHALKDQHLRLRFDWALVFHTGATHILGFEQHEKERILRVDVPHALETDEQRKSFRVDHVGHSTGAISTPEGLILRASIEDISSNGVCLFATEAVDPEKIRTGMELRLSITLEQGPTFQCRARLCHSEGQSLGIAFLPGLSESAQEGLNQWLEPRIQEARRRWENRAELRARAELASRPKEQPAGIMLLTQNESLAEQITATLAQTLPVRTLTLAMGVLMEAQAQPPLLVILDPGRADVEDRRRCKAILEKVGMKAPLVVLGDGQNTVGGRQLATDLKAAYLDWNPQQEIFFQRFIRGLIRQFWNTEIGEF